MKLKLSVHFQYDSLAIMSIFDTISVIFDFAQKVEKLDQPVFTALHWTNRHFC